MTESLASTKLTRWIRPLIGGVLSALIAWISLTTDLVAYFGFVSFYIIPFLILDLIISMNRLFETQIVLVSLLFWFPVGFATALIFKDNSKAIFGWLLLCIIFGVVGFFVYRMIG